MLLNKRKRLFEVLCGVQYRESSKIRVGREGMEGGEESGRMPGNPSFVLTQHTHTHPKKTQNNHRKAQSFRFCDKTDGTNNFGKVGCCMMNV